jgi:hypothetical protein
MVHRIAIPPMGLLLAHHLRIERAGLENGPLSQQYGALGRRRRLRVQQQELQGGAQDSQSLPPYPFRPRPPS